jgi:UDP-3-O-[3-hydroxymyristoyl] glucosamine N-acyltransferase
MKFIRTNFFPHKRTFDLNHFQKFHKEHILFNSYTDNFEINEISSLSYFRDNSFLFLEKDMDILDIKDKRIHIVSDIEKNKNYYKNISIVKNLNISYNLICNELFYHEDHIDYKDDFNYINGSYISKYSNIHKSTLIGKNNIISRGVEIGKNSIIKNNVVIKSSILGNNVIVCDNASIGTSGFGFDFNNRGSLNFNPQLGITIIDDNVHIGASCAIDRGKIDYTYIGKNTMIDNMVHIAHNVVVGNNGCIAAQTGISGSVQIGNNVTIGGQAGLSGHITIGENVIIAAKSGVTKDIKDNSVVAGFPAIDMKKWKKNIVRQRKNGH